MNTTEQKVRDSLVLNGRALLYHIERKEFQLSTDLQNYFYLSKLIVGGTDFRSRTEDTGIIPGLSPHEFNKDIKINETFNKNLSDLMDQRATELIAWSKKQNKKIYVCWSGGIDSTAILVSLLKNSDEAFKKNIEVVLSSSSFLENIEFYKKYILNKLEGYSYNSFKIDGTFLRNNTFLCGDLADLIFNSIPFEPTLGSNYSNIKDKSKIIDILNEKSLKVYNHNSIGEWFFNFLETNISNSNTTLNLTTFDDYCWWININLRWNFESQRYLFYLKDRWNEELDTALISDYIKNVFFNTKDFQNWSYMNLKNGYIEKMEIKDYIFDFDQNIVYRNYKLKERGSPPNLRNRYFQYIPVVVNKNYTSDLSTDQLHDFLLTL
jgi:hypothetical protein